MEAPRVVTTKCSGGCGLDHLHGYAGARGDEIVDEAVRLEPRQYCVRCGAGPFFFVPGRRLRADLCLDCADVVFGRS